MVEIPCVAEVLYDGVETCHSALEAMPTAPDVEYGGTSSDVNVVASAGDVVAASTLPAHGTYPHHHLPPPHRLRLCLESRLVLCAHVECHTRKMSAKMATFPSNYAHMSIVLASH